MSDESAHAIPLIRHVDKVLVARYYDGVKKDVKVLVDKLIINHISNETGAADDKDV